MVSGLLSIDLIILMTWQITDPLQRRLESFPLEDPMSSNDDIKIRPQLEHCESDNNSVWLGNNILTQFSSVLFKLYKLFYDSRFNIWLQGSDSGLRSIPSVRDAFDQSKTDKRLSLRWNEHLQCGCIVSDNCASSYGYCLTTGRIVCIYVAGRHILLFSQHVADICAKGKSAHSGQINGNILINWIFITFLT